ELPAAGLGGASQACGYLLPLAIGRSQIGGLPLFLTEAGAESFEEFLSRGGLGGGVPARPHFQFTHPPVCDTPVVASLALFMPSLVSELVSGNGDQQLHELLRVAQIILPGGRADKKTPQYRLTDVHGVESAGKSWIPQTQANLCANEWLVLPNQLHR